jgi:hypothetical protein
MLEESRISEYIPTYPFEEFYLVIKNSNGVFEFPVIDDIKFNNIIIYSDNLVPLGFTDIAQVIDTSVNGIRVIQVKFDYTISSDNNYHVDINFISYSQHLSRTSNVHKKLFSTKYRNVKAISRRDVRDIPEYDALTTKSIYEMRLNPELIGRYSGNLFMDFKELTSKKWTVNNLEIPYLHDIIKVNGIDYLVSARGSIVFKDIDNNSIQIIAPDNYIVGSNIIISNNGDIYSTMDSLRSGELIKVGDLGSNLYVKDNLTKMIHFYRVETNGIITSDRWLNDVLYNLGQTNLAYELKSVSEGVIAYEDSGKTYFCTVYNRIPAEVVGTFSMLKQVTNDLFIGRFNAIEDMGLFLIKLGVSYTYNQGIAHEYASATQIYLGKNGRYKKLDLLSKNVSPGVLKTNLSDITYEGCCWYIERVTQFESNLRRL